MLVQGRESVSRLFVIVGHFIVSPVGRRAFREFCARNE